MAKNQTAKHVSIQPTFLRRKEKIPVYTGNVKTVSKIESSSPPSCCAVFPQSKIFALGWTDGAIEVRKTDTLEIIQTFSRTRENPVTCLSAFEYTFDDYYPTLLASYSDGISIVWDIDGENLILPIEEKTSILVNAWNYDGKTIALGGLNRKIKVYDLNTLKLCRVLNDSIDKPPADASKRLCLRFHPTREYELVSGGWDNTIQFWDTRQELSTREIRGLNIFGDGIDFLDGNRIVTAQYSTKDPLQLWDYGSGKWIKDIKLKDQKSLLHCCKYDDSDSSLCVGGSNDMCVMNTKTWEIIGSIQNLEGPVYFARNLPKKNDREPYEPSKGSAVRKRGEILPRRVCFCSGKHVHVVEIADEISSPSN